MTGIKPSSYYDSTQRAGAALNRARRPFLLRNALTGAGVLALSIGIYVYTLKVIGMDEFEDVKPARKPEQSEIQAQVAQLQKR